MKALSVKQPFAMFLVNGSKSLEIRSRKTNYKGDVLICSSQNIHKSKCLVFRGNEFGFVDCELHYKMVNLHSDILSSEIGHAIGIATLVDCFPFERKDEHIWNSRIAFIGNQFAWKFENPRVLLNPFPIKGKVSFFEIDTTERDMSFRKGYAKPYFEGANEKGLLKSK